MEFADPVAREAFFALHSDLPREGPGNRDSTARALTLAGNLPAKPRVLDIACGPGAQTADLAALLPGARIEGVSVAWAGQPAKEAVLAEAAEEIAVFRACARWYGYAFLVLAPLTGAGE